jgi:hypothetical protein
MKCTTVMNMLKENEFDIVVLNLCVVRKLNKYMHIYEGLFSIIGKEKKRIDHDYQDNKIIGVFFPRTVNAQ